MEQKKTVQNVDIGDRITAKYAGAHPNTAVTGEVIKNDETSCVIRQDNGREAIIFSGDQEGNPARGFVAVQVRKV